MTLRLESGAALLTEAGAVLRLEADLAAGAEVAGLPVIQLTAPARRIDLTAPARRILARRIT